MKNVGKAFEDAIKDSIPYWCLYYRLHDPPQSFGGSSKLRFSWKNPCDCFVFDSRTGKLYCLELKTTKENSFSFEDINIKGKQPNKMIHKHQINGLLEYSKFDNVICGFVLNFRESNGNETTYFIDINEFMKMINEIGKKSFNKKDLLNYDILEFKDNKKRTKYLWDMKELFG